VNMPDEDLRKISAWEIRLMLDAAEGLTNFQIAKRHAKTPKSIDKSFERLREKLREYGGHTKAGLVHWIDLNYELWCLANGLLPPPAKLAN
jgi:hypothetical protein